MERYNLNEKIVCNAIQPKCDIVKINIENLEREQSNNMWPLERNSINTKLRRHIIRENSEHNLREHNTVKKLKALPIESCDEALTDWVSRVEVAICHVALSPQVWYRVSLDYCDFHNYAESHLQGPQRAKLRFGFHQSNEINWCMT